jgi:hypothetical protein
LLEILKFVLGKFRVWGFGEYFFEMFALREWGVVEWRLLAFGSVLFLHHLGSFEFADVFFDWVHFFEDQRNAQWILMSTQLSLSGWLFIAWILIIVDRRMTVHPKPSDVHHRGFGHLIEIVFKMVAELPIKRFI